MNTPIVVTKLVKNLQEHYVEAASQEVLYGLTIVAKGCDCYCYTCIK